MQLVSYRMNRTVWRNGPVAASPEVTILPGEAKENQSVVLHCIVPRMCSVQAHIWPNSGLPGRG